MTDNNKKELVEEYIGDKIIPIEEFINPFFEDEEYELDAGKEYFGYIARWSEKKPYWAFFIQVESKGKVLGTAGSCNFGSSGSHMPMEELVFILNTFAKHNKKIIVNTEGYFAD